jgi:hypothetical protein
MEITKNPIFVGASELSKRIREQARSYKTQIVPERGISTDDPEIYKYFQDFQYRSK